ncbi:hypothetical protein BLOT_007344 [Blomia tropicalis]|nr:hypothetical protein BLOT_007344 [Blomia tropicalis]
MEKNSNRMKNVLTLYKLTGNMFNTAAIDIWQLANLNIEKSDIRIKMDKSSDVRLDQITHQIPEDDEEIQMISNLIQTQVS